MWTDGPEKRLLSWREFREQLSKLSKEEAILETVRLWSKAPISNQYLAADLAKDWPDPWQLIHYNHYDDISITLGMVYTLILSDATNRFNNVDIKVLKHKSTGEVLHTAWLEDGKYILNYYYNEISSVDELSEDLIVRYKYSYDDLKLDQYK